MRSQIFQIGATKKNTASDSLTVNQPGIYSNIWAVEGTLIQECDNTVIVNRFTSEPGSDCASASGSAGTIGTRSASESSESSVVLRIRGAPGEARAEMLHAD